MNDLMTIKTNELMNKKLASRLNSVKKCMETIGRNKWKVADELRAIYEDELYKDDFSNETTDNEPTDNEPTDNETPDNNTIDNEPILSYEEMVASITDFINANIDNVKEIARLYEFVKMLQAEQEL